MSITKYTVKAALEHLVLNLYLLQNNSFDGFIVLFHFKNILSDAI